MMKRALFRAEEAVSSDTCLELQKLPKFRFSRLNRNITVKYLSMVCKGVDLDRQAMARERDAPIVNNSTRIFRAFYEEMVEILQPLRKMVKSTDGFDVDSFLTYLSGKQSELPKTNEQLFQLWTAYLHRPQSIVDYASSVDVVMPDPEFWSFISDIRQSALDEERGAEALRGLVKKLAKLPPKEIVSFHRTLVEKLYALDTYQHALGAEETSDDAFVYVRCYVVGKGQAYYERALADPSSMPKDPPWFEPLLYVAAEAWAQASSDDPSNFPWNLAVADKSYWTGSNIKGWEDAR